MGQALSPMGAHSVSGDTAPVITECHPGRPWGIKKNISFIAVINNEENNSQNMIPVQRFSVIHAQRHI